MVATTDLTGRIQDLARRHADEVGTAIAMAVVVPSIALGHVTYNLATGSATDGPVLRDAAEVLAGNPATLRPLWFLVALAATATAWHHRRRPRFLAAAAAIVAMLPTAWSAGLADLVGLAGPVSIGPFPARHLLYTAAALFIVVAVLPRCSLTGRAHLAIVVILVIEAVTTMVGLPIVVFGWVFQHHQVAPINTLAFLALLALLRSGVKIYTENQNVWDDLRQNHQLGRQATDALKLWAPIGLVFLLATGLGQYWQNNVLKPAVIGYVHDDTVGPPVERCVPGEVSVASFGIWVVGEPECHQVCATAATAPTEVTVALDRYITRNNCLLKAEIRNGLDRTLGQGVAHGDELKANVEAALPTRFPGTEGEKCELWPPRKWLDGPRCGTSNLAKSVINAAYGKARAAALAEVNRRIDDAGEDAEAARAAVEEYFETNLDALVGAATPRIYQIGAAVGMLQVVMLVYGLLILAKSFLVVFARVYYSERGLGRLAGTNRAARAVPGKITVHKSQAKVRSGAKKSWYFTFDVLGPNAIDMRRIPQFWSLLLARIRSGRYVLCRIDGVRSDSRSRVELKVDLPGNIVEWEIKAGETVYVNLRDVIGFQHNLILGRRWSFHLSSLVFGRLLYHTVSAPEGGDGVLYLATEAEALAEASNRTGKVMQSSSLVAWSENCEFNVRSSLKRVDLFFSGYSVARVNRQRFLALYDKSQDRRAGAGRGLWRTVMTFLVPF